MSLYPDFSVVSTGEYRGESQQQHKDMVGIKKTTRREGGGWKAAGREGGERRGAAGLCVVLCYVLCRGLVVFGSAMMIFVSLGKEVVAVFR